jgi:hypothetical protein
VWPDCEKLQFSDSLHILSTPQIGQIHFCSLFASKAFNTWVMNSTSQVDVDWRACGCSFVVLPAKNYLQWSRRHLDQHSPVITLNLNEFSFEHGFTESPVWNWFYPGISAISASYVKQEASPVPGEVKMSEDSIQNCAQAWRCPRLRITHPRD